ncbi:50S ribosomal protein L25/general stress protein Ctc [Metapseudomonas otitidis]|jgi:large subunit ribosomal protein L25|uniref:Large ribosomal subunit protein bL25 n=1 Tax=Metapseudomonas otitidis TaxID=319939 RepID=A0A1I0URZ7_9GAMM|nr:MULTISPECIES: 50S ribosomal protein L25/general stress protein Ctc [Pseudomonas]MDL5596441.1 50S ribosomal protein L25/general stress protein Ctc [Bacillus subtilis]KIV72454.1 LSU ribosomal protein L25p [Pseudomonas sp. FeS53a]MBO2928857.1 50S ribosomal protein L25/general stress protein Ctc [Pseudomonas otitidis]MCO7556474.1 50S ribosomal protein L25/general stress protein Ctc [Pseudomonas otitidis]MCP1620295.1 large subunit ribosomal protein L25 [Pseudomonas otitidis]
MTEFALNASVRSDLGKGASRRLRRNEAQVPAVVYGGDKAPQSIGLLAKELAKLLENEAAFSHVIALNVAGATETVLIKALQRHPSKGFVVHADFQRVVAGQKLTAHVPLHFLNEATAVGVKTGGGEISHTISEVEVSCLPKDLPEFIEVDLAKVEVGQTVHLSDLKLPKGVELVALAHGNDLAVANIHAARVAKEEGSAE